MAVRAFVISKQPCCRHFDRLIVCHNITSERAYLRWLGELYTDRISLRTAHITPNTHLIIVSNSNCIEADVSVHARARAHMTSQC